MNRIFLAGLLGCVAMYTWEYIAYNALPFGFTGFRKLPNEAAVLAALQNSIAENSGIYFFPNAAPGTNPPEKKAEARTDFAARMARYPSGILIYNAAGSRSVEKSRWLLAEFLIEFVEALLAVFLLSLTRLTTFGARLGFVLLIGVMGAIATNLGYWNWHGFPWSYTLLTIFIQVVGFLCLGLVAAFVLRKQAFGVSDREFLPRIWRAILGD